MRKILLLKLLMKNMMILHSKYKEYFEEYTKTLDELKELKSERKTFIVK